MVLALTASDTRLHAQRREPGVGAAWLFQNVHDGTSAGEARSALLDTPMLPGSIAKTITLVAALESHLVEPESGHMCRRVVRVDGVQYVCSHPDLKRPMTPAEALAHSCNDFFVSLATRLSRTAVNNVRARVGLAPIPATATWSAALVGLDGPRATPRQLLRAVTRLVGVGGRAADMAPTTRQVLIDGLTGAASYGTASELAGRGLRAMAKTGTVPTPQGGSLGLVVALVPAEAPQRGLIVVAPGAAGRDATSIAGDLLATPPRRLRVGSPRGDRPGAVRVMELEDYVARVVAAEGLATAPRAAQEALAIAVRTYALANEHRHAHEGYALCDTTHCQVLGSPTPATTKAALATVGQVLLQANRPAAIFYSASCGGHSELPSRVWPGAVDPSFLRAQRDEACGSSASWTSELSVLDIERGLRAAGLRGSGLRSLSVASRSASGRVTRLRAEGFVPSELSGETFRLALGRTAGWHLLKSTAFDLRRTAGGYLATGRGFGHGVGMCVAEAACRATAGASARAILAFYYPGLAIGDAPIARGGVTPAHIALGLPAAEEHERPTIERIVRAGLADIAARADVVAPSGIRVTVHPSVSIFARASRQPWWVAGSTRGTEIDLLPVSTLRQRGILERTIRHELAHVLIDNTLVSRPMWVREGVAAYFADPTWRSAPTAGPCPADRTLLEPTTAAAWRDAYDRAEQCVRRQIDLGAHWSAVR